MAHSWRESDTYIPRAVVRPLQRLMNLETSTAVAALSVAVIAMIVANTPLQPAYESFWRTPVRFEVAGHSLVDFSLRSLVNDGLMVLFFLVVALEIKREWVFGGLRDRRAAALPIIAAAGGMIVPALIYAAFNAGGPASHGWGVPMATDIAFAVAVLVAVGSRVPTSARLFLLTLAIADDLGAILVIAIFYTGDLRLAWLAAAIGMMVLAWIFQRIRVRAIGVYVVIGVLCWYFMHESGVHATIAGVAMGLLTPAWSLMAPQKYPAIASQLVGEVSQRLADGVLTHEEHGLNDGTLREIRRLSLETRSPLDRIEYRLSSWSAFFIVPVFAFANAGLVIPRVSPLEWFSDPVVLGVGLGLVIGKAIGVFCSSWLAVRMGVARMPVGLTNVHLMGVSLCAGVGFTVAMFVANLAFTDGQLLESAKLGIIVGSLVAGVLGYLVLRFTPGGESAPRE